jgi:hypothetical protein
MGLLVFSLAAQSNEVIDEVLEQDPAHLSGVAYLLTTAGGLLEESANLQQALDFIQDKGWVGADAASSDEVTVEQFAFLLMKSLGLRGGIMYSIFQGPRYAYREMVFQSVIDSTLDRYDILSGDQVLRYLASAMQIRGGR